jgi:hypothetical protein
VSYDLTFLRKPADQSWEEAFEALEERADDEVPGELPDGETWAGIVAAARQARGDVTTHGEARFYELDHEDTGIQPCIYPSSAAITVPYWYAGVDAETIVRRIYELGQIVERHTGLTGYDPQVELPIASAAARPELAVAIFDQVAAAFARRGIRSPSNNN